MKHQTFLKQKVVLFSRFCRKSYAVFRSMHRVVNIGHLASYITDLQLKKSMSVLSLTMLLYMVPVEAQTDDSIDVRILPTLNVIANVDSLQGSPDAVAVITHFQLQGLAVTSVGDLLEQLPGIDLRTRGGQDVQSDLTLRGGTFDQVIVLLNGINLNDAQTGHHNLDIPIDLALVDRVEVIPASSLIHFGVTSLCGAINIVTVDNHHSDAQVSLSYGSFNQLHASASKAFNIGSWQLMSALSYHRSDGYIPNTDFSHANLWLQALKNDSYGYWLIQLGGQAKEFGSQAFYSSRYPSQYESTNTLIASLTRQRKWNGFDLEYSAYSRLHKDRFELFRDGYTEIPDWYTCHNYHFSINAGLRIRASRLWTLGRTSFGGEMREEAILSNVLGDSLSRPVTVLLEPQGIYYSLGKNRLTTNIFLEHSVYWKKVKFSASVLGSHNSLLGDNYGFSLTFSSPLSQSLSVDGSLGRSLRLPTYTDLYYHSANQISNPNLKSEYGNNAELNINYHLKKIQASGTVFARHGTNIIDWVRAIDEEIWHSVNHAQIDALGTNIQVSYHTNGALRQLRVGYSYCYLYQQADDYVSNYVLDYLRHKLNVDAEVSPFKNFRIKILTSYQHRVGSYTDSDGNQQNYQPVFLVNSEVEYDILPFTVFVEGYNLLNRIYFDYGGIVQPGISILAGIRLKL